MRYEDNVYLKQKQLEANIIKLKADHYFIHNESSIKTRLSYDTNDIISMYNNGVIRAVSYALKKLKEMLSPDTIEKIKQDVLDNSLRIIKE